MRTPSLKSIQKWSKFLSAVCSSYTRLLALGSRSFVTAFVLVWVGLFSSAMAAAADRSVVSFRSPRNFSVVVPVYVNGSGPYEFLLDTGSSCTAVDAELRKSLKLDLLETGTVTTVTGRSSVYVTVAKTVSIGTVSESNVELVVRDLAGLHTLDANIRGVLGQNVLKNADYLLDNRNGVLRFDGSGKLLRSLSGDRVEMSKIATPDNPDYSSYAVRVRFAGDSAREWNLMLDSGSASVVLFADLPPSLLASRVAQSFVEDDTGHRRSVPQYKVRVMIGSLSRELQAHVTGARFGATALDGLLPTASFGSLYISNTRGFVIFEPKISRRKLPSRVFADLSQRAASPPS